LSDDPTRGPGSLVDEQGRVVCERCGVARTLATRTRGLLGRRALEPGEGLLITRTSSVHTFFMAFRIDVVFLDRSLRVRSIARDVAPFRVVGRLGRGCVLELAAGEARRVGIEQGSRLAWGGSRS
jgi:uncharacterized membrane protein (UPF0127 family)